jgi:hypothetical protein
MLKIEYEVQLNESGRPCITLPDDYDEKPEDKFFAMELTRYVLAGVYNRKSAKFDKYNAEKLEECINVLGQISDEVAAILYGQMKMAGELSMELNKQYHIMLKTIEERNDISYNGIIYNEKLFERKAGLKVLVLADMKIYELQNGIDNENWTEVK